MIKTIIFFISLLLGGSISAVPDAPMSISTTSAFNDKLTLYWDASTGATTYGIYVNGVLFDYSPTNVYPVFKLLQGVQYTFGADARDSSGASAVSVYVTFTPRVSTGSVAFPPVPALVSGMDSTGAILHGSAVVDPNGNTAIVVSNIRSIQAQGMSNSAYTWETYTATPLNGTTTTGVNFPFMLTLAPNFGGSAIKFSFHNTTYTPEYLISQGLGEVIYTSGTALTYGPFEAGMLFSVIAIGSQVTGTQSVYPVK